MATMGHHGLVIRTSASQAEGPEFDSRVARLLYWTKSDHYPKVPLHPGVKLGSPFKSELGTALDVKTIGENDVSHSTERDSQTPIEDALCIDEAET